MKIAWTTDPHLNCVDDSVVDSFIQTIRDAQPDSLLVGGDIGESPTFSEYLDRLAGALQLPVYFVLGNHDYYRGSIAATRSAADRLCKRNEWLIWLSNSDPVFLSESTSLIGHGGWGDSRAADFLNSDIILNDYLLIDELRQACGAGETLPDEILSEGLRDQLQKLGDETAEHFRLVLPAALKRCDHVVVLMHVPPFRQACWHAGKMSDDNWAPHFTCIVAGDVLTEFALRCPNKQFTVLCGHTHSPGYVKIQENLEVWTGEAEYGTPQIQRILNVD